MYPQRNPNISMGIDWLMIWLYAALCIIGLICIFSVEYRSPDNVIQSFLGFKKNYSKQLFFCSQYINSHFHITNG
jgi:rod shape determining protein RodA